MKQQRTFFLSVASAIGGALLLFVGQVAIEEYKTYRHSAAEARAAEEAREDKALADQEASEAKALAAQEARDRAQTELVDKLTGEFDELGPTATRAGRYVDSGAGGSKDDVNAVAGHFRILIRYIVNGRIDILRVGSYYGGRLGYWSERFRLLANNLSPAASNFSEKERKSFGLLSDALDEIIPRIDAAQRQDALAKVEGEMRPSEAAAPMSTGVAVARYLPILLILLVSVVLAFVLIRWVVRRSRG